MCIRLVNKCFNYLPFNIQTISGDDYIFMSCIVIAVIIGKSIDSMIFTGFGRSLNIFYEYLVGMFMCILIRYYYIKLTNNMPTFVFLPIR